MAKLTPPERPRVLRIRDDRWLLWNPWVFSAGLLVALTILWWLFMREP